MSFINELDVYIQTIMYDVEICNKVKNYIDVQMLKWGKFMNKEMLPYFADIDMKYVSMFKETGISIAMGNGADIAKENASIIAPNIVYV